MSSVDEFKRKMKKFETNFKRSKPNFYIPGGSSRYWVTEVKIDSRVTITQGTSLQPHLVEHLEGLYIHGEFKAPRLNKIYTRNDRTGHMVMKNAIVDYLKSLPLKRAVRWSSE